MALSSHLSKNGFEPKLLRTEAKVHLEKVGEGFRITKIELFLEGDVPGIAEAQFIEFAEDAKKHCPVSQALSSVEITLDAKLVTDPPLKK
jgi:osmotically inducible protein OsmC